MTNEGQAHIALVLGTARKGRKSHRVSRALEHALKEHGYRVTLIDVADHLIARTIDSRDDAPETDEWREVARAADCFVWVVPEYNHSFPGEFKVLIDSAPKEVYRRKPIGLVSVSDGGFGGARLTEVLRSLASVLGATPVSRVLNVSHVSETFGEEGEVFDEMYQGRIVDMITDIDWYIAHMRS
jgi:NAD(P)H-dependent FMN reductase